MHRPPFRADHIGSLLRPPALRQAYRAFNDRALDEAGFVAAQDAAIRDAVTLQAEAGLAVVTDGEFRRASYWSRFVERTEGLSVSESRFTFRDEQGLELTFTAPLVTGKVARQRPIVLDEFCFLRDNANALPKATLPAPSTMHFWRGSGYAVPGIYDSPEKFFRDLAAVYRAEIAALAAAGCRYIQLDEVALAMLCDPVVRQRVTADGNDPARLTSLYVEALGDAIASAPPAMAVGVHMCRGNFKGKYLAEGGYDTIAKALFGVTGVTHFLLEFDTARAGDFAPLRFRRGGQRRRARPRQLEKRRARNGRRFAQTHRRSGALHRQAPARHQPAMRLRLYRRRQSVERSRRARQAGAMRPDRSGGVGLKKPRLISRADAAAGSPRYWCPTDRGRTAA